VRTFESLPRRFLESKFDSRLRKKPHGFVACGVPMFSREQAWMQPSFSRKVIAWAD
jgi:hypothetical protein